MTETAPKPRQLSLREMQTLIEKRPDLIEPFKLVRPKLEDGTGQQELANLIECEVGLSQEGSLYVYSWSGINGAPYEMRVPKAFDPHSQQRSEPQQQAQIQEPEPLTEIADTPSSPFEDTPLEAEATETNTKVTTGGMFAVLAQLVGDATLLMTVASSGETGGEARLTVTVVPEGESDLSPICLTGTAGELDAHFVAALSSRAESEVGLEAQIEALKAADKALEDAKKEEIAAKHKQAEAKKKATQKKEAETKAGAEEAEKKAEAEKQQATMFQ